MKKAIVSIVALLLLIIPMSFISAEADVETTVDIVYPSDGDVVSGGINITVDATEDIEKVRFSINGNSKFVTFNRPFDYRWFTPAYLDGWYDISVTGYTYYNGEVYDVISVYVTDGNTPPDAPTIDAPSEVKSGVPIEFRISTSDVDNDYVKYGFDNNNDGAIDFWSEFIHINETYIHNFTFYSDKHTVSVIACDDFYALSDWTHHTLTVPKYKLFYNLLEYIRNILNNFYWLVA